MHRCDRRQASRKVGFSVSVSDRALKVLYLSFGSFAHVGSSDHRRSLNPSASSVPACEVGRKPCRG